VKQACLQLEKILDASRGRAFVLFTSYAQMQQVYRSLKGRLRFPMLLQGEKPRGLLSTLPPHSVLFATSSFGKVWMSGRAVELRGHRQTAVAVPSDPVVAARIRYLNKLAETLSTIKFEAIIYSQGLGRLIRVERTGDPGSARQTHPDQELRPDLLLSLPPRR
jgi:ATP-dependent DNA helicase DinG